MDFSRPSLRTVLVGILLGISSAAITTAMAAVVFARFPQYLGIGTALLLIAAAIQRLVYIRLCQHPNAIATPLVEQLVVLGALVAQTAPIIPDTQPTFLTLIVLFLGASWITGLSLWLWGRFNLSHWAYFKLWTGHLPTWLFGGFLMGVAFNIILTLIELPTNLAIASFLIGLVFIIFSYRGWTMVIAPMILASVFISPWLPDDWLLSLASLEVGQHLGEVHWEVVFTQLFSVDVLTLVLVTFIATYFNLAAIQPPLSDNLSEQHQQIDSHFRYIAIINMVSAAPGSVTAPDSIMATRLGVKSVWLPIFGAVIYLVLLAVLFLSSLSFPQFMLSGLMLWLANGLILQGFQYHKTPLEAIAAIMLGISILVLGFSILIVWVLALLAFRLIETHVLTR